MSEQMNESTPPRARMTKDILAAASTLGAREARFLVDSYYNAQDDRKRSFNQERALAASGEPNSVIGWMADQDKFKENQIKRALDKFTAAHPMGEWMREVKGIGPVLSAGILAYIDIEKAPTVGHIWRYAGLDPTQSWTSAAAAAAWVKVNGLDVIAASRAFNIKYETLYRGATTDISGKAVKLTAESLAGAICRRPWNARLKLLCHKIGDSFLKLSNDQGCYYGVVYRQRKAFEIERNESGGNSEKAAAALVAKRYSTTTDAYKHLKSGKLPPAQIDARARRYAVKLFLAHLHQVWFERHFGEPAPMPYAIAFMGHAHFIAPPHQ